MNLLNMKPLFDIFMYIAIAITAVSLLIFIFKKAGVNRFKKVEVGPPLTFGIVLFILSYFESFSIADENEALVRLADSVLGENLNYPFKYIFALCIAVLWAVAIVEVASKCIKYLIKKIKHKREGMAQK